MTWRERVIEAERRGFNHNDVNDASDWLACAVWEQHVMYPEVVKYHGTCAPVPTDDVLRLLGGSGFCGAVLLQSPDRAHAMLDAIEDRVLELKRAHHNQNP